MKFTPMSPDFFLNHAGCGLIVCALLACLGGCAGDDGRDSISDTEGASAVDLLAGEGRSKDGMVADGWLDSAGELAPDGVSETYSVTGDIAGDAFLDVSLPEVAPTEVAEDVPCPADTVNCISCATDGDCGKDAHCQGSLCEPDVCVKGKQECANESTAVQCDEHGTEFTFTTCQPGEICAWGKCAAKLCEPYAKWCTEDYYLAVCDGSGTGIQKVACPAGLACFYDVCAPILHNLYVVFDTSGSMYDSISCQPFNEPFCEEPWPVCEQMGGAYSPLGISKSAFHTVFADQAEAGARANFVLFRFPDEIDGNYPTCSTGYYDSTEELTGDDGVHLTSDGPESWFEKHLSQVVSVPFPASPGPDNLKQCLRWVDFEEVFEPVGEVSCSSSADCPGGACLLSQDDKLCHYHTNPELRAQGSTPLGKTMFYAGEYIRKFVVVDGKPCSVDIDCGNPNYRCGTAGKCIDPVAHCRQNTLLLFTDGNDTENSSTFDFFNPMVQAKRFHYGLGCEEDNDCIGEAVCTPGKLFCQPADLWGFVEYADTIQGADLLRDYNGSPIQLTVHVVHLGGSNSENEQIAVNGGGDFHAVDGGDLPALVGALNAIVDAKDATEVCVPGE